MNYLNWVAEHPWLTAILLTIVLSGIEEIVTAARRKSE
jgi:hypothetical protein